MRSVKPSLGVEVCNSLENHKYITNVNNNFQQYGIYTYGTPVDLKA
jgi:hypothetical protein